MNKEGKPIFGQFNDSFPPVMDGVANVVRNYAYWLDRRHGECYVITPAYPGYVDREPFPVLRYYSMPLKGREPYRVGLEMLDLNFRSNIRNIPFDLVHSHSPFSTGFVALHIARRHKIPIIATFHSKFYDDIKQVMKLDGVTQLITDLIMNYFDRVDQVWAVSNSTAETLREYGFRKPVEVVPNGADFDREPVDERLLMKINCKYRIQPEDWVMLFVGQHIRQKNTLLLIDALNILHKAGFPFTMVFVGTGVAAAEMEERVAHYGLGEHVRFLGSILDRELLRGLYSRADLFTFPSVYDNAPLVVREAAAAATPSLLISGSNSAEGVRDGFNGFLAEESAESVAEKILEIRKRDDLAEIGRNAANTLYRNWSEIVEEVHGRYLDLIDFKRKQS
ncbi:MAG: glycosyltransferase [Bacteroidota bacterium]